MCGLARGAPDRWVSHDHVGHMRPCLGQDDNLEKCETRISTALVPTLVTERSAALEGAADEVAVDMNVVAAPMLATAPVQARRRKRKT